MRNNDIILNLPSRNEGRLLFRYDSIHEGLEAIDKNFRNNFVNKSAQANWTKLIDQFRVVYLGDKRDIGVFTSLSKFPSRKKLLTASKTSSPTTSQYFWKKMPGKPSEPGALRGPY